MLNRKKLSIKRSGDNKSNHGRKRHGSFADAKREIEREKFGLERNGIDKDRTKLLSEVLALLNTVNLKRAKFRIKPSGPFPKNNSEVTMVTLQAQKAWLENEIVHLNGVIAKL